MEMAAMNVSARQRRQSRRMLVEVRSWLSAQGTCQAGCGRPCTRTATERDARGVGTRFALCATCSIPATPRAAAAVPPAKRSAAYDAAEFRGGACPDHRGARDARIRDQLR
jgi:hypothetical protein